MPVIMFEFSESDLQYIKDILVDTYQDCDILLDGREEKGIKLKENLSPKDFYAFMAIFIQNKTTWRR
ncbi:MAG: hypothetical protein ABH874_03360 [Methanobacteriota archaeon]